MDIEQIKTILIERLEEYKVIHLPYAVETCDVRHIERMESEILEMEGIISSIFPTITQLDMANLNVPDGANIMYVFNMLKSFK
jgi:hypothetical protein